LSRELIRDLYRHQAWADAEHWRAILGVPAFLQDARAKERLHHIHLVQRGFHAILAGGPFEITEPSDYDGPALLAWARAYHAASLPAVESLTAARLAERVTIPWFKDPPLSITVEEALLQSIMHSHYHRGQNATRLRELGGEPPTTDFIVWLWQGRPEPGWP
jgi:uncharacterized damage-inducible protein DinB